VYSGYTIPPNYDSMIKKLITTAQSREEASKMRRALDEFVIEGIKTTIPFHRQLMDDPRYIAGIILLLLWIRLNDCSRIKVIKNKTSLSVRFFYVCFSFLQGFLSAI
jgi:acetyl/propionyl-CoA carboxylase alpha subunit